MTTLHSNNLQLQQINTSTRNGISAVAGMLVYNTQSGLQMYDGSQWQTVAANFSATGGTESEISRSGYKVHTFTSPGTFAMTGSTDVEYLIIGGGGGGGSDRGGGGGAGLPVGQGGTGPNNGTNGNEGAAATNGELAGEGGGGTNNDGEAYGGFGGDGGSPNEAADNGGVGQGGEGSTASGGNGGGDGAAIRRTNGSIQVNISDPSNSLNGRGSTTATTVQ